MKKNILLIFVALLMSHAAVAHPVDVATALQVGTTFMRAQGLSKEAKLVDATARTPFTLIYLLTTGGDDFVLVSADDCVRPIVGFSLDSRFEAQDMPAHVSDWYIAYEAQIRQAIERERQLGRRGLRNSQQVALAREWTELASGAMPPMPLTSSKSPMLTTTWDQAPRYNNLCPQDNSAGYYYGYRAVAGCVATATAQVMRYHAHPTQGKGSHSYTHSKYGTLSADFGSTTYQWSQMPNALSYSSTTAQINAVATLIYHVGVADEMNYNTASAGGSSANNYNYMGSLVPSSQSSLMRYFGYSPLVCAIGREDMEPDEWSSLLRSELDANRPVLLSGQSSSAGHSFVVDGYNASGLFHINWGWGGSNDGYYAMGSLDPSSSGIGGNPESSYNGRNVGLFNLMPDTNTAGSTVVSVSATAGGTVSGAGTYDEGSEVELYAQANTGYRFAGWDDGSFFNPRGMVVNGGDFGFHATFLPVGGDTLGYCGHGQQLSALNANRWGIRIPSQSIEVGSMLQAVEFYAVQAGSYTLNLYSGITSPTNTLYTKGVYVGTSDINQWVTILLDSTIALDPSLDLWIALQTSSGGYPAAVTYGCGHSYGLLTGNNLTSGGWKQFSFMIRGIASGNVFQQGDTLSYCGPKPYHQGWGTDQASFRWGISIPPEVLSGRNRVRTVQYYADHAAAYSISLFLGDDDAPLSLMQTVDDTASAQGWRTVQLSSPQRFNPDSTLWIVLQAPSDDAAPAAACLFTGSPSSDWISTDGSSWQHASSAWGISASWMIKAVVEEFVPTYYKVSVSSDNKDMGIASGNGTYEEGTMATIKATAKKGCQFARWEIAENGSTTTTTDNPYSLLVQGDAVCTAYFDSIAPADTDSVGIAMVDVRTLTLYPNPTSGLVGLTLSDAAHGTLHLFDMQGREVMTLSIEGAEAAVDLSSLPAGLYLVRLLTGDGATLVGKINLQH